MASFGILPLGRQGFWIWTISYRRNTYWQFLNAHFINRLYQPNVDKLGRISLDSLKAKVSLAFEISRALCSSRCVSQWWKDIGSSGRQRKWDYRSRLIIKCISLLLFSQHAFLLLHLVFQKYYRIKSHIPSRQRQKKELTSYYYWTFNFFVCINLCGNDIWICSFGPKPNSGYIISF